MAHPTPRRRPVRVLTGVCAAVFALAACTSPTGEPAGDADADPSPSAAPASAPIAIGHSPEAPVSILAGEDAEELAVGASDAFFRASEVAVVAGDGEASAVRASAIGLALGVPTLPEPAAAELTRLGVSEVITVGFDGDAALSAVTSHRAPDDVADLAGFLGISLTEVPAPSEGAAANLINELAPGEVPAAEPSGEGDPAGPGSTHDPETSESPFSDYTSTETVPDAYAFARDDPTCVLAVATARAAGAQVAVTDADPRVAAAEMDGLETAAAVVGMGPGYEDPGLFEWMITVASSGGELPGGGALVFDGTRYVALYGSLHARELGILGHQDVPETLERAESLAAEYADLTEDVVVPALEIIVTVASGSAGADGNYSSELPPEDFVDVIERAGEAGQYVVLDFQPGRTDFLTQVMQYSQLLEYPHVGVALDPEWRLSPGQRHMVSIGSVTASEVNDTVDYVAEFVREHDLPQKMIILHQFQTRMISDRADLRTTHPETALLIHADGHGTPSQKFATWRTLHENAPDVWWGWKNFTVEDSPMFTPTETYEIDPAPEFVSYQ